MQDIAVLETRLRDAPGDWESWLVYADWLGDQGDARGELIVLEHKLATQTLSPEERLATKRQIGAIKAAHRQQWFAVASLPEATRLQWRHGFLWGVTLEGKGDGKAFEALIAHPTARFLDRVQFFRLPRTSLRARLRALQGSRIRTLSLVEVPLRSQGLEWLLSHIVEGLTGLELVQNELGEEDVVELARAPQLCTLTALSLSDPARNKGTIALAESAVMSSLVSLRLNGYVGDEARDALLHSTSLKELRALAPGNILRHISNTPCPEAMVELLRSPIGAALTELDFENVWLGTEEVVALARSAPPGTLTSLSFREKFLSAEAAIALARSDALSSLTWLDLSGCRIGEEGVAALARSTTLRGLTMLNLSRNSIREQGAAALARSENFSALTDLDLSNNDLGPEGAAALARSSAFPALKRLHLASARIRDAGAMALARSETLRSLVELDLGANQLDTEGAVALAQSPNLRSLTTLRLSSNTIRDGGAIALASSPMLCELEVLELQFNYLHHAGITAILQSPTLSLLTELDLRSNAFEGAVEALNQTTLGQLARLKVEVEGFYGLSDEEEQALARFATLYGFRVER